MTQLLVYQLFMLYICIIKITDMIPTAILNQIGDQMFISRGTTHTITGAADDSNFMLKIGCDNKGNYSFIFGVLITADGAFDLVELIETELLLNNVLHT